MNTSVDCPDCGTTMELTNIPDLYKCPSCGKEVDMFEEEDDY